VVGVAVLIIISWGYSRKLLAEKKATYTRLQRKNKDKKTELGKFKKFIKQIDKVSEWNDRKLNWLDELKILAEVLPETSQAYVKDIRLIEGTKSDVRAEIIIEGRAKSRHIVDGIYEKLAELGRYGEPKPGKLTDEPGRSYPHTFKVTLRIPAGKSEPGKDKTTKKTLSAVSTQPQEP